MLSHPNSNDVKAIEQKAREEHEEADQARKAVQEVLMQKLSFSSRTKSVKKEKK
jgi:hypothetical protein